MKKILLGVGLLILLFVYGCQQTTSEGNIAKTEVQFIGDQKVLVESKIVEDDFYTYSLHYPEIEAEEWNKEITEWVEGRLHRFLHEVSSLRTKDVHWQFELHIDFEMFHLSERFISMKMRESKFLGGANTEQRTVTFNFDRIEKRFLELSDVFQKRSNYLQTLSELSYEKLMDIPEMQELVWDEHFQSGIDPFEENFAAFTIDENKLHLFFQHYQVGPRSVGAPSIEIEVEEISSLLNNKYASLFLNEKQHDENEQIENEPMVTLDVTEPHPDKKQVALTFDDGPHPTYTSQVLDILSQYEARATFFVLGNRIEFHPELLIRMMQEGHEIGNHSWSHPKFTNLTEQEILSQLNKTTAEIEKVVGQQEIIVRPPYGDTNEFVQQLIPYPIITWTVDTEDWKSRDRDQIIQAVKEQVFDGAIILMHDIYPSTVAALDEAIDWLIEENYELVTVSELLVRNNDEALEAGSVYSSYKK